ncbi:alpha-amylase family glycosyl hydrolase [uncultured Alistipes sp.]|uniref:alpha-amylase family glycosyl hydrolase n=1 Tax=uncultured Alistipes sp. TaxID=538949 RepID=UPI0025DFEBBE|nr:alpha-amylase family glycosyl hydrolase [uncultured Alistipes sp.]
MKRLLIFLAVLLLTACATQRQQPAHPDWSYNSVVYEMNIRQYTPEGTFAAAARELPRLRELGVDVLWLMPIYPIGVKERKGTLGSYYAISDYEAVNPEFGTMDDFDRFLADAHSQGFRVILDWVANHTSPDARWIEEQPADWYVRDSLGRTIVQYDWTDIAKLNYDNRDMRRAMVSAMRFWLDRGIDGFRFDMACEVPMDFWYDELPPLRRDYPGIFLLAEGENPALHKDNTFDASYAWELHHLLNAVARGEKSAADLRAYVEKDAATYPREAFRLMFTSNHDENSWAGTEFERMGEAARVMALLTFTLPNGQPLIYTGQEMGYDRRFAFFEKDPVAQWKQNDFTGFYNSLIRLRHQNPAFDAGERGGKAVYPDDMPLPEKLMFFSRSALDNEVIVAANLSATEITFTLPFDGTRRDFFTGAEYAGGSQASLPAWQYLVFIR